MALSFDPAQIDWNLLRALGAVLTEGSLTAAARRLGTSQPTLSRQVAQLEAQVGAPLFERTARGLKPTAMAQALAEPAQRMLAAAQALSAAAQPAPRALAGSVRLAASQVVSTLVLPPILAELAATHPEIQVELVPSDRVSNLLDHEADIAVRMLRPTQGTLITRHLADWPLGLYAHQRLIERHGGPPRADAPLDELAHWHWLGQDQHTDFLRGFHSAGFDIDRRFFGLRCDDHVVLFQALAAGVGAGIAMQPLARRQPHLVAVLQHLPLPALPVWLTAHRELRSSARLKAVWDFLALQLVAWGEGP